MKRDCLKYYKNMVKEVTTSPAAGVGLDPPVDVSAGDNNNKDNNNKNNDSDPIGKETGKKLNKQEEVSDEDDEEEEDSDDGDDGGDYDNYDACADEEDRHS